MPNRSPESHTKKTYISKKMTSSAVESVGRDVMNGIINIEKNHICAENKSEKDI